MKVYLHKVADLESHQFDHVGLYWNPAVAIWFFPKRWGRESN